MPTPSRRTASGQYQVSDPALRSEILKLRSDPTANAAMAGAFTKANAAALSDRLGRAPSEGELYIAHFLGAGGAARLITLAASNPNAKAADFFPNAAQANSSIFYDRATAPPAASRRCAMSSPPAMTWRAKTQEPGRRRHRRPGKPQQRRPHVAAAAPDTAGITNAFAAAVPHARPRDDQVFHGTVCGSKPHRAGRTGRERALGCAERGPGTARRRHTRSMTAAEIFEDSPAGL